MPRACLVRFSVYRAKKKDFGCEYRLALGSLSEIDRPVLLRDGHVGFQRITDRLLSLSLLQTDLGEQGRRPGISLLGRDRILSVSMANPLASMCATIGSNAVSSRKSVASFASPSCAESPSSQSVQIVGVVLRVS
jgi:hypothetical protein